MISLPIAVFASFSFNLPLFRASFSERDATHPLRRSLSSDHRLALINVPATAPPAPRSAPNYTGMHPSLQEKVPPPSCPVVTLCVFVCLSV